MPLGARPDEREVCNVPRAAGSIIETAAAGGAKADVQYFAKFVPELKFVRVWTWVEVVAHPARAAAVMSDERTSEV